MHQATSLQPEWDWVLAMLQIDSPDVLRVYHQWIYYVHGWPGICFALPVSSWPSMTLTHRHLQTQTSAVDCILSPNSTSRPVASSPRDDDESPDLRAKQALELRATPECEEPTSMCKWNPTNSVDGHDRLLRSLSETWLDCSVPDGMISIPEHRIVRRGRRRHDGGLHLAICCPDMYSSRCKRKDDFENNNCMGSYLGGDQNPQEEDYSYLFAQSTNLQSPAVISWMTFPEVLVIWALTYCLIPQHQGDCNPSMRNWAWHSYYSRTN